MTICTCWISLVLRVIREAVENRSSSALEKETTLPNTWLRSRMETPAAVRLASRPTMIAAATDSRVTPSILAPTDSI